MCVRVRLEVYQPAGGFPEGGFPEGEPFYYPSYFELII